MLKFGLARTRIKCMRDIPPNKPRVKLYTLLILLTQSLCCCFISKSIFSWVDSIPSPSASIFLWLVISMFGLNFFSTLWNLPVIKLSTDLWIFFCWTLSPLSYSISKSSLLNSSWTNSGSLLTSSGFKLSSLIRPANLLWLYFDFWLFQPSEWWKS